MKRTYVGVGLIFPCGRGVFISGMNSTGELLRYWQSLREQYE